jgi:hypothetical protein
LEKETVDLSRVLNTRFLDHSHQSDYAVIATMMGIVQNNSRMIRQYGSSFCDFLGITGCKELSALDKVNYLVLINKKQDKFVSYTKAMKNAQEGRFDPSS